MAFKSKVSASVGLSGSPTVITDTVVSGATHTVVGLSLANISTSPVTTSVKLLKSAGGSAFLVKDATVAVGGALIVVGGDQKVCLETGDSITAYASAASSIDVALSYLV